MPMQHTFATIVAAIVSLLFAAPPAHAAIFTVGSDDTCTHHSIQEALDAVHSAKVPSEVRIAYTTDWTEQALIARPEARLVLTGGYPNCRMNEPGSNWAALNGAGSAQAPVLRIVAPAGVEVLIDRLRIIGGDAGSANGGGIQFHGGGTLALRDMRLSGNTGANGGAIYARGDQPGARLVIGRNVQIFANSAWLSGGGVFIEDMAFTMLEPGSIISNNSAFGGDDNGYGGGLFIRGRNAVARIGSAGIDPLGAIAGNRARCGGGVAVFHGADLQLYKTSGSRAAIRHNRAAVAGGAVFVQGGPGNDRATAHLWNAELTGNRAPAGAAVYVTHNSGQAIGGALLVNVAKPQDATDCSLDAPCGTISDNVAVDQNDVPTQGAIIHLHQGALGVIGSELAGVRLGGNRGGRLIDALPNADGLAVRNALIVDNHLDVHLLRARQTDVSILDSTIAGNAVGTRDVLAINANLAFRRSILWQPRMTSLSRSGGTLSVSDIITSEAATLGGAPLAIEADPRFADPARGDYRPRAASPAVDYALATPENDRDIASRLRDVDIAIRPNAEGPRDVGAFELPGVDNLLYNGSFDTDLNLWWVPLGVATWDGTQGADAYLEPRPGSIRVSGSTGIGTRLVGARQCIHLPGPGRYLLDGHGRSGSGFGVQADAVVLNWELRRDGGENCIAGLPDASGDLFITRANTWTHAAAPAEIFVPASMWTTNTSVMVSLVMVDSGIGWPRQVDGWFDAIFLGTELPPECPWLFCP